MIDFGASMIGPLSLAIAYLLGSIPFGFLIVRSRKGIDVRATGSGSTGATNVMRSLGMAGFVATFLLDLMKGFAAEEIALKLTAADPLWTAGAAVAAIIGHCFPVWLKFRGGKGVATALGVFLALAPREAAIALAVFLATVAVFRYVSLGSVIAAGVFPALFYAFRSPPTLLVLGSAASAGIIIARHRSNIARLLKGTESKLGKKDSGSGNPE